MNPNRKNLRIALEAQTNRPCDKCIWHDHCAAKKLACWDFTAWVNTGSPKRFNKAGELQKPDRRPKAFLYDRLLCDGGPRPTTRRKRT